MADSDLVTSEMLTASPLMASVLGTLVTFSCTQSELKLTVTSCSRKERGKPACVKDYVERIVPRYHDITFKTHFLMYRCTFEVIYSDTECKHHSH